MTAPSSDDKDGEVSPLELARCWNSLPDDFGPDHISMKGLKILAAEVIRLSAPLPELQPPSGETPRFDDFMEGIVGLPHLNVIEALADFARQLERELDAMTEDAMHAMLVADAWKNKAESVRSTSGTRSVECIECGVIFDPEWKEKDVAVRSARQERSK